MLASPEYPRESAAGRSRAIRRSARKPPKALPRLARPKVSFPLGLLGSALVPILQERPHLHRQSDQVDEAASVLLIVLGAHREAGDVERVQRIRRLAADRLESALVKPQRDLAGVVFSGLGKEC